MIATSAINSYAIAPTTSYITGEEIATTENNSRIGLKMPPVSTKRAYLATFYDLGRIDAQTMVLRYNGIYMGLDEILYRLSRCENCGYGKGCIVDTNGKLSCGKYCFQKRTFEGFCPELKWNDNPTDDTTCAIKMIMMGIGQDHWVNCWRSQKFPII